MNFSYISSWIATIVVGGVAGLLVIHGQEALALTALAMIVPGTLPKSAPPAAPAETAK